MDLTQSALLPLAPSSLCFDKNEFMRKDFSVDQFVADCRRRVQLETLRQDLEVYFKLLKNAMIELINKDYADFVNLSANLIGMDKAIAQLRNPLTQIKDSMTGVGDLMDDKISQIEKLMEQRQDLTSDRDRLSHMIKLLRSVEKIEHIQSSEDVSSGQVLERIAGEFNELQHHAGFCSGLPVLSQVRPRISEITANLQQRLEQLLLQGVQTTDVALLHRCLNSYALIGKTRDAEKLVQAHLVHPYMMQVVQEQHGDVSAKGIKSLFAKIIDFIPNYCKLLCDITAGRLTELSDNYRGIVGYDFIVRSVWPEVVQVIENGLSAIFSPGYPDAFHTRYSLCMDFMTSMERQCGSQASVLRLRQSEEFTRFLSHWSLPVYFQMRFQEIGGKLEEALDSGNKTSEGELFKLNTSATLYSCIETCWRESVFLPALVHRFWKVTLQCMSRYIGWSGTLLNSVEQPKESCAVDSDKKETQSLSVLVGLSYDISTLIQLIDKFFKEKIEPILVECELKDIGYLHIALDSALSTFKKQRVEISNGIVSHLTTKCSLYLRHAQDVPRLFRHTNRDIPSKSSSYVTNVLKSVIAFREEHSTSVDDDLMKSWLTECACNISEKFLAVVSDVLAAVRKMEESLMRLQKMRAGKSSGNLASLDDTKLSDDDKIRIQLYLDVMAFSESLEGIGIDTGKVAKLQELKILVTEARPSEKLDS